MAFIQFQDIVFVYHFRSEQDYLWHSRSHSHKENEYELHYFIEGEGRFKGESTTNIEAGQLYFSKPGEVHRVDAPHSHSALIYYAVLFKIDLAVSESRNLMDRVLECTPLNIGTNYRFFFEEIREKALSGDRFRQKSAIHQFISFLYLMSSGSQAFHYGDDRNRHIERALKIMQQNVYNKLSLDEISRKLDLSESYFIRLFKDKMNTTPKKYYTRLKIEAATSLLSGTEQPLYKIAETLQFSSEFHFSRSFKQYTGLSPRDYRKRIHHERELWL